MQKIERECHDENVFLKAGRAISKFNFLFHLKSKPNLVPLRKCNSHLQYYKIDLSFSIKLQETNLNVCEEYKTEREIQTERSARREAYNENVHAKRADFFTYCTCKLINEKNILSFRTNKIQIIYLSRERGAL